MVEYFASLIIAGYYAVIAGFVINYGFISAAGLETGAAAAVYEAEKANFGNDVLVFIFLFASGFVVANGIDKGIDKAMRFLLPMLFVLVIAMVGYGAVAGDFSSGLNYLFHHGKLKIFQLELFKLL